MKNITLLPDDLRDEVRWFRWTCHCGQDGLAVSVTKKGTIQGHCFSCSYTIFFNDPQIFRFENPFCFTDETPITKTTPKGFITSWYPSHRVRTFSRPR